MLHVYYDIMFQLVLPINLINVAGKLASGTLLNVDDSVQIHFYYMIVILKHTVYMYIISLRISILWIIKRVTQYVVPFVTNIRTKETKPVLVGQVQGYLISSLNFVTWK